MITENDLEQVRLNKSDMSRHVDRIYQASKGAKRIVEIGVEKGNSTRILLKVIQETGGELFSIDIADCSSAIPACKAQGWTFKKVDSAIWECPWESIDILFIDGDDFRAHKDFSRYEKFIKAGGKIIMHDSLWRPISDFVDNLDREKFEVVKYDDCFGLSIITKKYY